MVIQLSFCDTKENSLDHLQYGKGGGYIHDRTTLSPFGA